MLMWLLIAPTPGIATTVDPPTLLQMVQRADRIFVGEVVNVRSYWTGTTIHTDVTFRSSATVKGPQSPVVLLTFLGGEVGDVALEVAGMPKFVQGDEQVLFSVDRAGQANPIVGFWHGRVVVTRDRASRAAHVLRFDQTPFSRASAVSERPSLTSAGVVVPMSLEAFLADVKKLVQEGGVR